MHYTFLHKKKKMANLQFVVTNFSYDNQCIFVKCIWLEIIFTILRLDYGDSEM